MKQKIPIQNPFTQTMYTFPREDTEGYCIFYDKQTRKCKIHPVKPETCVAGPITFDINKQTQKIEWYLKMEKICPLAGILHKNGEILRKHLESAKKEILRLVYGLEPEALRAILKIEEPETFKIDEDNIESNIVDKLRN
jgi:Fe-S-cluster containining protein